MTLCLFRRRGLSGLVPLLFRGDRAGMVLCSFRRSCSGAVFSLFLSVESKHCLYDVIFLHGGSALDSAASGEHAEIRKMNCLILFFCHMSLFLMVIRKTSLRHPDGRRMNCNLGC